MTIGGQDKGQLPRRRLPVLEGVRNLITHCLDVQAGESVLLLNEYGKMDPDLVRLMEETIRACGAEAHSLWGESVRPESNSYSKVLIGAMRSADKVVMSYTLDRELLNPYLMDLQVVRVNNRCRTATTMASDHARFDWRMVRAIYGRLEELFSSGSTWRVSSLSGTNISGHISTASEVADAYFAREAEVNRVYRVFPGETYTPVGSSAATGAIVVDDPGATEANTCNDPVTIHVEDNHIACLEGGDGEKHMRAVLESHWARYGDKAYEVDSFHGGMNPRAVNDPKGIGAISTTERMHFHERTLAAHYGAGITNPTVEIDGREIYAAGRLVALDEEALREAAQRYGAALPVAAD